MQVTRTVKVKIDLEPVLAEAFIATYTAACNAASRLAFGLARPSNSLALNAVAYGPVRALGLSAQVAQSVVRAVAGKYTALKMAKVRPGKPVAFRFEPVQLQGGDRGRDFGFTKDGRISVTTLEGRVKVTFQAGPNLETYRSSWDMGGARLFVRAGTVYLLISYSKEVQSVLAPNNAVVGVDRGIKNIAAITDGENDRLVGGKQLLDKRDKYQSVKASIQSRKAQRPTSSLRKLLKRLSGKERRYGADVDHVIARQIVAFAKRAGSPVIALEDLSGIGGGSKVGGKTRKWIHRWSFFRLAGFIEYKAEQEGFTVVRVDPRYTSQGCSRCGHTERANRNGVVFKCKACGFELHADLQAARNIRLRGILKRQETPVPRAGQTPVPRAGQTPVPRAGQDGGGAVNHPEVAALDRVHDGLPGDKLPALAGSG